jgi:hypothetical protein
MARRISQIVAAVLRALVGASAGLFCALVAARLTTYYFGLVFLERFARGDLVLVIGALTAAGAMVAFLMGVREIPGWIGLALKGMAWGIVAGLLAGGTLGFALSSTSRSPDLAAAGLEMGIFMGVYIGAIFGGVIGGTAAIKPEKKSPSWPSCGVHDRELDG